MPILCRTPEDCFETFEDHVAALVAKTLTRRHPFTIQGTGDRGILCFRAGGETAVPIKTRFGHLYVSLAQALFAQAEGKQFRLRTLAYWYRLLAKPDPRTQALIRWEYDSGAPADGHCRHHVQMPTVLPIGAGLDLDKAHVPTGWVTLEEVLRFLIVDLGVKPPCGSKWPAILADSERAFFEEFTGKRYKPPEAPPEKRPRQ